MAEMRKDEERAKVDLQRANLNLPPAFESGLSTAPGMARDSWGRPNPVADVAAQSGVGTALGFGVNRLVRDVASDTANRVNLGARSVLDSQKELVSNANDIFVKPFAGVAAPAAEANSSLGRGIMDFGYSALTGSDKSLFTPQAQASSAPTPVAGKLVNLNAIASDIAGAENYAPIGVDPTVFQRGIQAAPTAVQQATEPAPLSYTGPAPPTDKVVGSFTPGGPPVTELDVSRIQGTQKYLADGNAKLKAAGKMTTDDYNKAGMGVQPAVAADSQQRGIRGGGGGGVEVINGDRVTRVGGGGTVLTNPGTVWLTGNVEQDKNSIAAYNAENNAWLGLKGELPLKQSQANLHNVTASEMPGENMSQADLRTAQAYQARKMGDAAGIRAEANKLYPVTTEVEDVQGNRNRSQVLVDAAGTQVYPAPQAPRVNQKTAIYNSLTPKQQSITAKYFSGKNPTSAEFEAYVKTLPQD